MNQAKLNKFKREYFDLSKRRYPNQIVHDSNTAFKHRILVDCICEWAREEGLIFFTKVYLKGGEITDIVIPDLSLPFLEIRHSELKKKKEYLSKYDDKRQFIDTTDPFKLR